MAKADVFNLRDAAEGWIRFEDFNNGALPADNYIAGYCAICHPPGNFRDWFEYAIPALGGTLTSATLELIEPPLGRSGGPQTFSVYSLSDRPFHFSDIGAGIFFGSVATSDALNGTVIDIPLNASALAAITANQGGNVFIGGIDSGEDSGAFDFGYSQDFTW